MRKVLLLYRNECNENVCKGVLFTLPRAKFHPIAHTLEPPLEVGGERGNTAGSGAALPHGRYRIKRIFSSKFKIFCYRVVEPSVAERAILIHMGNTRADTRGCILVGEYWKNKTTLADSRKAFSKLPAFDDGFLYILNPDDRLEHMSDDEAVELAVKAGNMKFFENSRYNTIKFEEHEN